MARLEDLTVGSSVGGLVNNATVQIVAVKWFGSSVLEVTYKNNQGMLASQLVYREDEARLQVEEGNLSWSFDADGDQMRLVSEAYRINLAHLFDPYLAVHHEAELLADCYRNSLRVAVDHQIRSVAFPSISTEVCSYPVEEAAKVAVATVNQFIEEHPGQLDLVEWVLYDEHTHSVYENVLNQLQVSKIVHSPRLDEINRMLRDGLI